MSRKTPPPSMGFDRMRVLIIALAVATSVSPAIA